MGESSLGTQMSNDIAEEEQNQREKLPQCGRLVFRGVELAYLNIDGEYMMPLAELLALVLPTTPRTTLFTRMEKMKVRRYFCLPEEIKLLKTVNGIHGSSANCTLLSKTEVDKYCALYVDKPSDSDESGKEENLKVAVSKDMKGDVTKGKEVMKSPRNDNEDSSKLAVRHKHKKLPRPKPRVKLAKLTKANNSGLLLDCRNQTLTGDKALLTIDGNIGAGNCNGCSEGFPLDSSQRVTNGTQTVSMVNRSSKKRIKKRKRPPNTDTKGKVPTRKKRSQSNVDYQREFESPSKIPKRSELKDQKGLSNIDESSHFSCNLKRQDFDVLVSDSSSNDSGFASTALLSNPSTPTKNEFPAGELNGLLKKDEETIKIHTSPCKVKIVTPKRNKKAREIEGNSLTLSPPALLLKRYENSWLVEQKQPIEGASRYLHKHEGKTKKPARPVKLTPSFDLCLSTASQSLSEQKQIGKRRKRRKPPSGKEEVRIKPQTRIELIAEKHEQERVKKVKQTPKETAHRGFEETLPINVDFAIPKVKKSAKKVLRQKKSEGKQLELNKLAKQGQLQQEAVLDKLADDALAKYFAPSSKPSSSPTKPREAKSAKRKVIFKKNCNFKLLNLFPITSPLSLHDGKLGPTFTMSCPFGNKPEPLHPLWKWNLGGPVVGGLPQTFKVPVHKKKSQSSNPTAKKVRKIKTKRKKQSSLENALPSVGLRHTSHDILASNIDQTISSTVFTNKSNLSAAREISLSS